MLEKEFKYYLENQQELLDLYENKYIAIVGDNVVGSYSNAAEALYDTDTKYEPGTCLIQLCTSGKVAYSVRAYSRYC